MEAKVIWKKNMQFDSTADSGFTLPLDARVEEGGAGEGFKPIELFLMGLAGCTAMDVISILGKKRQEVTKFDVQVQAVRAKEHPKVFTDIEIVYRITGKSIDQAAAERAIQLSEEKYCPAQAMLSKVVPIRSRLEIMEG
jgi:putative redox protein